MNASGALGPPVGHLLPSIHHRRVAEGQASKILMLVRLKGACSTERGTAFTVRLVKVREGGTALVIFLSLSAPTPTTAHVEKKNSRFLFLADGSVGGTISASRRSAVC